MSDDTFMGTGELTPGATYKARLLGGPKDGETTDVIAEGTQPEADIQIDLDDDNVASYHYVGGTFVGGQPQTATYQFSWNTLDTPPK